MLLFFTLLECNQQIIREVGRDTWSEGVVGLFPAVADFDLT
jgi:hypothetical protein